MSAPNGKPMRVPATPVVGPIEQWPLVAGLPPQVLHDPSLVPDGGLMQDEFAGRKAWGSSVLMLFGEPTDLDIDTAYEHCKSSTQYGNAYYSKQSVAFERTEKSGFGDKSVIEEMLAQPHRFFGVEFRPVAFKIIPQRPMFHDVDRPSKAEKIIFLTARDGTLKAIDGALFETLRQRFINVPDLCFLSSRSTHTPFLMKALEAPAGWKEKAVVCALGPEYVHAVLDPMTAAFCNEQNQKLIKLERKNN